MVPELEEREAAAEAGLTWREYLDLNFYEKADMIAVFRIQKLLGLVRSEVTAEAQEDEARKAAQKTRRR